jgi:hypothetical protein
MPESLDLEIRSRLARYLAGEHDVGQFASWFHPYTWNIQQRASEQAVDLAYTIDLLLSEHSSGGWTESQLHDQLRPFVESYSTCLSFSGAPVVRGGAGTLTFERQISPEMGPQPKSADIALEWALA